MKWCQIIFSTAKNQFSPLQIKNQIVKNCLPCANINWNSRICGYQKLFEDLQYEKQKPQMWNMFCGNSLKLYIEYMTTTMLCYNGRQYRFLCLPCTIHWTLYTFICIIIVICRQVVSVHHVGSQSTLLDQRMNKYLFIWLWFDIMLFIINCTYSTNKCYLF